MLLAMLADGRLHLSGIAKLAPHLTRENRDPLLERATHRSKRHIEELAAVRRTVHARDGNRCRYVDEQGRRCSERDRLEYHHRHPFGLGGDHCPQDIGLMCRAHNQYLAAHDYGREAMARGPASGNRVSAETVVTCT